VAKDMCIRPARRDDLERLQQIEVRAGSLFVEVGLPEIAAHPPPTIDELQAAAELLVAIVPEGAPDAPVGYAWIEIVDGHTHLEQLSVLPELGGQGIGTRLLDAVADWARDRGDTEITLTTFRDVPFNEPLYLRRGFEAIPDDERPAGLIALMGEEAAHGLDSLRRVAMRRRL
jgi:GNAT superfamily N-acetyltransferase